MTEHIELSNVAKRMADLVVDNVGTIHDYLDTLVLVDDLKEQEAADAILEGLAELARNGLIIWTFEPNYGNTPGIAPADYGEAAFVSDWQRCTASHPLRRCETPDSRNPTLDIDKSTRINQVIW